MTTIHKHRPCPFCGGDAKLFTRDIYDTTPEVRRAVFDWGQAHDYTLIQTEIDDLLNRIERVIQQKPDAPLTVATDLAQQKI